MSSAKSLQAQAIGQSYFQHIWQVIVFLLGLSIFVSKSGLSLFALLAVVFAIPQIQFRNIWQERPAFFFIALLYPLLFMMNLFSLDGLNSSLTILHAWPWPLMVLPAIVLFKKSKDLKIFIIGSSLGLMIAIVYGYYLLWSQYQFDLSKMDRLLSFWDIGRWGVFLGVACLWLVGMLNSKELKFTHNRQRIAYYLFLLICLGSFVLSKTRGPFLGVVLGLLLFGVMLPKIRKMIAVMAALLVTAVLLTPNMKERVLSIFDIQTSETGQLTSTHVSNSARLNMWKVSADFLQEQPFFGTGYDSTRAPLTAFVQKQTDEYRQKYTGGDFSFSDQHSSYMNFLVQNGVLFFLLMMSLYFWITVKGFLHFLKSKQTGVLIALAILLAYYVIFFFYATLQSFDSVFFFMALAYICLAWPARRQIHRPTGLASTLPSDTPSSSLLRQQLEFQKRTAP